MAAIIALLLSVIATVVVVALAIRKRHVQLGEPLDADDMQIRALRASGVRMHRALEVRATAVFPSVTLANEAGARMRHMALSTTVTSEPGSGTATLRLRGKFVPTRVAIRSLRIELELVAEELGGTYEGWDVVAS